MKKLLSILLVVIMVVTMMSVATFSGFAAETPASSVTATYNNVKKGDILLYNYYLKCDKSVMNAQCEIFYSDNLKPVETVDEYGDADLAFMLPKLKGIAFNIDSNPIHFNYSYINGINFSTKGCMMNVYFVATQDGSASVTANMKIMQAKDNSLLVFDYETQKGAAFELTSTLTKPATTPTVKLFGDVNGDGNINVNDASLIQMHTAKITLAKFDETVADVNGDGNINVNDASIVQMYSANLQLAKSIKAGKYINPAA